MAHRTKVAILQERIEAARKALRDLESQLNGLDTVAFDAPCSKCGTYLATELDFAEHYLVPDERYYNLGYCSVKGLSE